MNGSLHHVELWVPDLGRAIRSWRLGDTYLVVEESSALSDTEGFEVVLVAGR